MKYPQMIVRRTPWSVLALALVTLSPPPAQAQGRGVDLRDGDDPVILSAVPDVAQHRLVVSGRDFDGRRPLHVHFNGAALTVQSATPTRIVATLPPSLAQPGSYLLVVGRGRDHKRNDDDFAMFEVTIGGAGLPGLPGLQGPPGAPGNTGAQGSIGPTGPQGATGETGAQGPIGPAGPQGATGDTGAQGPTGPEGAAGETGLPGPQGPAGKDGTNGSNGIDGTNGTSGTNGTNGTDGIDGTSVTFVDYFSGNQGGCPNGGAIYATGNPPVNTHVCNGTNGTNGADGGAGTVPEPEPMQPVLHLNGWKDFENPGGGAFEGVRYFKDLAGIVHLQGVLQAPPGSSTGSVMFELPAGYAPELRLLFGQPCDSNATCRVQVEANGQVRIASGISANALLSLSGLSFRVP